MTESLRNAHAVWRFAVLIGGGVALARMWIGWLGNRAWEFNDQRVTIFFLTALDLEILIGLLLWLLQGRWRGEELLRSWQHPASMILAGLIVHAGWIVAGRSAEIRQRFRLAALTFAAAGSLIVVSVLRLQDIL